MIQAARYLGTQPWILEYAPLRWYQYALIMIRAEKRAKGATVTVHEF